MAGFAARPADERCLPVLAAAQRPRRGRPPIALACVTALRGEPSRRQRAGKRQAMRAGRGHRVPTRTVHARVSSTSTPRGSGGSSATTPALRRLGAEAVASWAGSTATPVDDARRRLRRHGHARAAAETGLSSSRRSPTLRLMGQRAVPRRPTWPTSPGWTRGPATSTGRAQLVARPSTPSGGAARTSTCPSCSVSAPACADPRADDDVAADLHRAPCGWPSEQGARVSRLRAALEAGRAARRPPGPTTGAASLAEAQAGPARPRSPAERRGRRSAPRPTDMAGPRVVILGGGMAGLATAWELSSGRLAAGAGLDHRLPARLAAGWQGREQPRPARPDRGARPARPPRLLRRDLPACFARCTRSSTGPSPIPACPIRDLA